MSAPAPSSVPVLAGRSGVLAAVLVGAVFLALLLYATFTRGPWYDEFFTLYVASPRFGWSEALRQHWLTDNHPPLFYALSRATSWLGESVGPRRLVNLLFLAAMLGWLVMLAQRSKEWRPALLLFGIALAGSPVALFYGAELRSNFMALAGAVSVCAGLAVLAGPHTPIPSRGAALGLLAALLLAFNTHFTASVLTGSVALAFLARLALTGDWRKAWWLTTLCVLAGLPLLATLAVQFTRIEANTQSFWLPAGFTAARWAVQAEIEWTLGSNVLITITAALAAIVTLTTQGRSNTARDPMATTALALLAGAVLGTTLLLTIHMWRPIVIARYLVAMVPPILLALSIGAAAVFERLKANHARLLLAVTVLIAFSAMGRSMAMLSREPSWNGTAKAISALVEQCPGTLVHADMQWNAPVRAMAPADNRDVMPVAYAMSAKANGFALEPEGSRRMAARCPTVFWTEHVSDVNPTPDDVAESIKARGYAVGRYRLERIGRGWIFVSLPEDQTRIGIST